MLFDSSSERIGLPATDAHCLALVDLHDCSAEVPPGERAVPKAGRSHLRGAGQEVRDQTDKLYGSCLYGDAHSRYYLPVNSFRKMGLEVDEEA